MKPLIRYTNHTVNFIEEILLTAIRTNRSVIAQIVRKKIYKTDCSIDTDVIITNLDNFQAGKNSALYHSSYILNDFGKFKIGQKSHLGAFCYVNVCYGQVEIGDDVAIGPGTKIIAYSNHYEKSKKVTEIRKTENVMISNNVFIGANCVILPGSIIEDNVIVGAGSVVKGNLASNFIYGGIPVRKIKGGWFE